VYNYLKRLLCVLLAASSIFCAVSCAGAADGIPDDTGASDTETPAETTPAELQPDLPESDFEEYTFTFLCRYIDDPHWAPWNPRDIFVEGQNGEVINDSVYTRNRFVEETYNINIEHYSPTDYVSVFNKTLSAGDDVYDVYYAGTGELINAAYSTRLNDLMQMPYIDLEKPWWNQNAVNALSVGGKLYFAVSDIMIMNNDCTSAIVFNKRLIEDNNLPDPYGMVTGGSWTIDNVIGICKDIARDVDGNSIMDYNDMYGFVCYRDASLSIMHSAGGRIAEKDSDDYPVLTLNSERAFAALDKAFDLMYSDGSFNVHKELEGKFPAIYEITERMFMENRSLLYWILLHDIEKFRDMEADFGILPIPKYDEEQEDYGCTVNQYHGYTMGVPVTVADRGRAGIILEALSAKSRYTLQPAYYDIALQRKFTRDDSSAEMLDIIFNSTVYDIGAIYNFGDFSWQIIYMTMTKNRDIASLYSRLEKSALNAIEKTADTYRKLED
jgi:hypothetical protein